MESFVSKYNLNFTNLNDADGSIWARFNVPWQPAYVFLPSGRHVDVREQPDVGDVGAGAQRPGARAACPEPPWMQDLIGLACAAGMVAALNPCGFAMLPAYLTLVVRGEGADPSRTAAVGRALVATAAMALRLPRGVRRVRPVDGLGRHRRAALPAVRDGRHRCRPCRPWHLAAGRPRTDLESGRLPAGGGRRPRGWVRCSATGSATPSRRCRARSGRSSRSPAAPFAAARWPTACSCTPPTPPVSRWWSACSRSRSR